MGITVSWNFRLSLANSFSVSSVAPALAPGRQLAMVAGVSSVIFLKTELPITRVCSLVGVQEFCFGLQLQRKRNAVYDPQNTIHSQAQSYIMLQDYFSGKGKDLVRMILPQWEDNSCIMKSCIMKSCIRNSFPQPEHRMDCELVFQHDNDHLPLRQ